MDGEVLVLAAAAAWVGVLIAGRSLFAGALVAAGCSIVASAAIVERGGLDSSLLLGRGGWAVLAEVIALGALAGWATRRLPVVPLAVVLAATTAAVVTISEWRQRTYVNGFISTALLIGLAGCVGAGALLRQSDRERSTAATSARRDERLAIARELHDVVAHHVTGMVVQAQAGQLVAPIDPARAAGTLAAIEQAGTEALTAMRRMVGALRVAEDSAVPTAPAASLHDLAELARHAEALGLPVRLHLDAGRLPAEVTQSVHRIVRESLTNARSHAAGATGVDVTVSRGSRALEVVITDDGRAGSGTGTGFGLVGMAERVQALGGAFHAGSRTDGPGWEVRATIPLDAEADR